MPSNITNIPAPRVDLIDPRTGLMSREWYRFFLNLFNVTGAGNNPVSLDDIQVGPPAINDVLGELGIVYDQAQISSMLAQYEQSVQNVQNQLDNQPSPPQLGTLSSINEDNVRLIGFSNNPSPAIPNPAPTGTLYWNGNSTLGLQMTQNVLLKIGQAQFVYVKASAAITKGELCKHTGSVGGSGVITAQPTSINMTDPNQIIGVAAENIALNGFGFIQTSGDIKGFNTTGSSVGEVWADGDPLYYNPSFVGGFTKTKPSAPNLKSYVGEIINAGSGGAGSINIRIQPGSVLGGTDSNVQFGALADKDLIQYDNALGYWKNVAYSTISVGVATNIAGGSAGALPYQTASDATGFLSIGAASQVLQVNSGATAPEWGSTTGTGNVVRMTSPTLVTPVLGAASATSLTLAIGSSTSPAITFSGDTNNGIYSPTTDAISVTTSGTERVRVDANGLMTGGYSAASGTALSVTSPAKFLISDNKTYTDTATAASGTVSHGPLVSLNASSIAATNATVTYTNASTLYLSGPPTAGTNVTITNPYTIYSATGTSYFGNQILIGVGGAGATSLANIYNSSTATQPRLQILGSSLSTGAASIINTSLQAAFTLGRTNSGLVSSGDVLARILFSGNDGTNYRNAAWIECAIDGTPGSADMPGRFVFSTSPDGSAVPLERLRIDSSGNVVVTGVGGLGYGTGSGGSVTQGTSRTQGVTLDKTNGAITLFSAAGSTTYQSFTVTNNKIAATDTIIVNQKSGTDKYIILVTAVAAGSFQITFATTGGTTTEQPVFNFAVIKAVTA